MNTLSGRNRLYLFYATLVLPTCLLLIACEREPSATVNNPNGQPTATSNESTSISADDQSLPNDDYIALGMPSYDRDWIGQDLTTVATVLETLPVEQLPRLNSTRSDKVFSRMISPNNLGMYRNQSIDLSVRLPQSLEALDGEGRLTKTYMSAFLKDRTFGEDLIHLLGHMLEIVQINIELINQYIPTISQDDPAYQARMDGLVKAKGGLANIVIGTLITLTETNNFSTRDRLKLLEYSRDTFPSIVPSLTTPSQTEVFRKISNMIDDPKLQDMRTQMILLRDDIQAEAGTTNQQN